MATDPTGRPPWTATVPSVAIGLVLGAAIGLLLLAPTIFGGDLVVGIVVGTGLGLLIGAVWDQLRSARPDRGS